MAQREIFTVTQIPNLQQSVRRGLAFLECLGNREINASRVFEQLNESNRRTVRNRFDHWLQGNRHDKYFHGWSNPEYRECFVFKWKMRNQHQRFYGFLCNPRPRTDRAFQVCVLVSHAQKNTEETDPSELNQVNELRVRIEVIEATKRAYPENDLH
jgi:hypothetical protein